MDLTAPQPHSIWLVPQGIVQARLKECISDLAKQTGNGPFDPHMTLVGDLQGPPIKTVQCCTAVLSGSGIIATRVAALSCGESFFKSLFLELIVPEELRGIRSDLCTELGAKGGAEFQPHISLAYDETSDGYDPETLSVVRQNFVGTTVKFTAVVVVSSAQNIPILEWRRLSKLPL